MPHPGGNPDDEFKMLVTMLESDSFVGRIATGRVSSGTAKIGDRLRVIKRDGRALNPLRILKPSAPGGPHRNSRVFSGTAKIRDRLRVIKGDGGDLNPENVNPNGPSWAASRTVGSPRAQPGSVNGSGSSSKTVEPKTPHDNVNFLAEKGNPAP